MGVSDNFSAREPAGTLSGTEVVALWKDGKNVKTTTQSIANLAETGTGFAVENTSSIQLEVVDGVLSSNAVFGSSAGTVCQGDDIRLTDSREPTTHDNSVHSDTYITASDITYTNLANNGVVGTGSSQISKGDHTHSGYAPSPTTPGTVEGLKAVVVDATKGISGFDYITSRIFSSNQTTTMEGKSNVFTGGVNYNSIDYRNSIGVNTSISPAGTYNYLNISGNVPFHFQWGDVTKFILTADGVLISSLTDVAPTLTNNSTMTFELTSNTQLKIIVKGVDGVLRSNTLTLS